MVTNQSEQSSMGLSSGDTIANEEMWNKEDFSDAKKLFEKEPIADTDFEVVGNDEAGWWVAFGKFRLTQPVGTKDEALEKLEKEAWKIMVKVSAIVHETLMAETARLLTEQAKKKS